MPPARPLRLPAELSLGLCGAPLATAAAPSHRLCRHYRTDAPLPRLPVVTVSSADVGRAGEDRSERQRRRQKADQIGLVRQGRAADRHVSEAELVRAAVHTEPTG
jgi:hypothetical protein